MKNIILAFAILLLTAVSASAQCDKKVKWQATKAEMLDTDGNVVDTKQGTIIIITDSKNVSLEIVENPSDKLEGTISDYSCEWKEAFKNGKTSFKTTLTNPNGETSTATFNIEGKDGKLTITLQLDRMNGKTIRIAVEKQEVIQ
jgi:hypothetical protein